MRIASIQYNPKFKQPQHNIKAVLNLINKARLSGAELIVLPELVLVGYSFMSKEDADPFAEDITAKRGYTAIMSKAAQKWGVHLVWGAIHKHMGTGDLFNVQIMACPDGSVSYYEKINLWGNDYLWATEGRMNPPIVSCKFSDRVLRVGLLICRDIRDKKDEKWDSFYEKGEADIVCLSANWGDGGFPAVSWMDFVSRNKIPLLVSNRWGKEANNDFGEGGICYVDAQGKVSCNGLVWNQDCMVLVDI